MKKSSRGFIGVIIIFVIALALAGVGLYFVYLHYSQPEAVIDVPGVEKVPDISISDTKAIALGIDAVLSANLTKLSRDCIQAAIDSREGTTLYISLHEIHTAGDSECKGNPESSPLITTLKMDTRTGVIFYQTDQSTFVRLTTVATSSMQTGGPAASSTVSSTASSTVTIDPKYVGVWQASSVMAAGWSDRYQLFADGVYNYRISQESCGERNKGDSGSFTINQNKLVLTPKLQYTVVGGAVVYNNMCGDQKTIKGGTLTETKIAAPKPRQVTVSECIRPEVDYYSCLMFDGVPYYRFNTDPTDNGNTELDKKPVF